jgi:thiol-disulfide isomerase/thioredoxin
MTVRSIAATLGAMFIAGALVTAQAPAVDREKASRTELDQGQLLIDHKEYFEGLKRLRRANELAGNRCAECLVSMLEAMNGMKAYQNTVDTAVNAFELAEGNPRLLSQAHTFRGEAFQALAVKDPSKYADAETEFRAALAADPASRVADDLHFNLGVSLLKQKRDEEGIAELKQAIAIRPDSFMADDAKKFIANPRLARENYAPDFSITTVDNQKVSLESLHGKVVLLDFWATWCAPCVKAVPSLQKLQKAHAADPFVMIAVSADESEDTWRRFTVKNNMVWPQYWDGSQRLREAFDVNAFPTYVLLDAEGIVQERITGSGFHESRSLGDAIERQIARAKR